MSDQTAPASQKNITVIVFLVMSALFVFFAVYDATVAASAKSRGVLETDMFYLKLPAMFEGSGRFTLLIAQLALPGLAIGFPLLVLVLGIVKKNKIALGLGAVFLLVGAGADFSLYRTLGAVPEDPVADNGGKRQFIKIDETPKEVNGAKTSKNGGQTKQEDNGNTTESTPATISNKPPVNTVGKIIYSHKEGEEGQWELWMMDPDGKNKEKISKTDRMHMQPRFSRDYSKIAITSKKDGKPWVLVMDWKTKDVKEICEGAQGSFSGDGKSVVYKRDGKIYKRGLDTDKEELITPASMTKCAYPSASPDDKWVAVAMRPLIGYNIYLVPTGGGDPKELVSGKGTCDPRWSPTGKYLSYQTETNIWIIKPDKTDKFQVSFGAGVQHYSTWAPDETKIAYCQGPGPNGPWQIYVVSVVEDEDPIRLTKKGSNIYPEWGSVPAPEESAE